MDFETLCIHAGTSKPDTTGAVSMPIFQSATFAHPSVGESTGFDYSRQQNPTRQQLEKVITALECGCDTIAYSSGMAAVTSFMDMFKEGDHLIVSDDLYGGTHRLFYNLCTTRGISFTQVDTSNADNIKSALTPRTCAVYIETPTNPMMHVTDITAVVRRLKDRDILVAVDNTFLTPYFQKPLELGADLVIHSGTKYLCGHNDVVAGFTVVKDSRIAERLRFLYKTTGACLSPFDSWLMLRSLKTLPVRLERQQNTASKLAVFLKSVPEIKAVHYPGLAEHSDFEVSAKQASGFGAMLSFETASRELAERILNRVKLIQYAESLGGAESLITYPMLQTHGDIPEQERLAKGITDRLLRLSVGLESAVDLIADLKQAIEGRDDL